MILVVRLALAITGASGVSTVAEHMGFLAAAGAYFAIELVISMAENPNW